MPRLEERGYTYFTTVRGMCRTCRDIVPARVFFRDGAVWQESLCPACDSVLTDRDDGVCPACGASAETTNPTQTGNEP